jgi:hypothetical protein
METEQFPTVSCDIRSNANIHQALGAVKLCPLFADLDQTGHIAVLPAVTGPNVFPHDRIDMHISIYFK